MIRAITKGTVVSLLIFFFILFSSIARLFIFDRNKRLHQQQSWVKIACQSLLKVFGIRLISRNHSKQKYGTFFIGNHLGFVDVISLASIQPSLFVTSVEMRQTPLLGYLTELGGCLYVERRNRTKILQEKDNIALALLQGFNIVLYPEGTSTDGTKVLPFKKTLLMAAAESQARVVPFAFKILEINNSPPTRETADALCWYGDTHFASGLWKLLQIKSALVELNFGESRVYPPDSERESLAIELHKEVSNLFSPLPAKSSFTVSS